MRCYSHFPTKKVLKREKLWTALSAPLFGFTLGKFLHEKDVLYCRRKYR